MEPNQRLEYVVSNLIRFRKLWIIPAAAGVLLALAYVLLFRAETWSARQSLIVRDDLLGQSFKPGQFNSLESMKSAQETILEIARKPQTLHSVLAKIGPDEKSLLSNADAYPDKKTIEDVQEMVSFHAPNGAEFGKTEVIILKTKSSSPERSLAFTQLLLDEIDVRFSDVRALRLQSMESELKQARNGAALSLKKSVDRLREMEGTLGAEIGTMNGLNSSQPNQGSAKTEIHQIRIEKRTAQIELDAATEAQALLAAAKVNPEKMLAMSADFLKTQPMLENLQKSLVDAQKAYADNFGRYEPEHPAVKSNAQTIEAMRQQIYLELDNLTRAVESRMGEVHTRIARLDSLIDAETDKLISVGSKRVDHLTINSEVAKKTEIYNLAESRLAEVQALAMATGQVAWLTRLGDPQLSTRPDGMGKKAMVMAGGCCGLMFGLGLVMLVAPPMETPVTGRPGRRSDSLRRVTETGESINIADADSKTVSPPIDQPLPPSPTLGEMFGPTAASAIHTASVATAATVSRGVSFAKSAFDKTRAKSGSTEAVKIPHVSPQELELADAATADLADDPTQQDLTLTDQTQSDQTQSDQTQTDQNQTDQNQTDQNQTEQAQAEQAQAAETQTDQVRTDQTQTDKMQTGQQVESSQPQTAQPPSAETEAAQPQPAMAAATPAPASSVPTLPAIATPAVTSPASAVPTPTASARGLDANAVAEVDHFASDNPSPAERMLAEIRSTLSVKNQYEMTSPTFTQDPKIAATEPPPKMGNLRPIDLLKSNQREEMADAAKKVARESMVTEQIPNPTMEKTDSILPPLPVTTASSSSPKENPFLKNLPKPKPATEDLAGSTAKIMLGQGTEPKVGGRQASESSSPNSAAATRQESAGRQSKTIPDQVKNLAESIANFANPPGNDS